MIIFGLLSLTIFTITTLNFEYLLRVLVLGSNTNYQSIVPGTFGPALLFVSTKRKSIKISAKEQVCKNHDQMKL